jgi:MFS family permease
VLGIVVRRFGRRIVMVGSIALAAGALAATAIPAPPVVLIAVAAAYGVFVGVCQPVTMAWLSELAPVGQRGMTMSLRLAGNRLGQAVIPITVGALAVAAGSGGVLVAVAVSLLVATWAGAAVPPVAVVDDPIPID